MSQFVVDCSVAMAWCFRDETNNASDGLLTSLPKRAAVVPSLWPIEVANVLVCAERFGRVTSDQVGVFATLFSSLNIEVDHAGLSMGLAGVIRLARTHRLTAYDATYLELALRRNLPLASRDKDLCKAARREGLSLIPA